MTMTHLKLAVFRIFLSTLLSVCLSISFSSCLERELVAKLNPGCPSHQCNDSTVEIVYVRADGPHDTVHYLWSFHEKPTILLAQTSLEGNLSVTWSNGTPEISSIHFMPPPFYSFGLLLNELYEFDDIDDTGFLNMSNTNKSYIQKIEMPDAWEMKKLKQNRDFVQLVMVGSWQQNHSFVRSGNLKLELETFRMEDHSFYLPHLLHSSNATQMDFGILHLSTASGFQQSRYALELIIAANESSESDLISQSFQSLDDEHAPGVFTLVDLQTSASRDNRKGGYLEWRPVAYVAAERDIVNSTETALYAVQNFNSSSTFRDTLLSVYFKSNLKNYLLKAVNISFGSKDDGFFAKNNMTFWTATVGYGYPLEDKFSLAITLVICIGFGVSALIIFISGIYIAMRLISQRRDDLFLIR